MSIKVIIPIFFLLVLFVNIAVSQEKQDNFKAIEQLNAKILELQRQIIEMQKKHEAEINDLKQQINELAVQAGKQEMNSPLCEN